MQKRSEIITLRVTKTEKIILGEAATTEGCSLNEYIHRKVFISAETKPQTFEPQTFEQAEPGNDTSTGFERAQQALAFKGSY